MTTVKATKVSNCEVSISLIEVAEIIRHELNTHGSRAAGVNIAIPLRADFAVERNETDATTFKLIFRWKE